SIQREIIDKFPFKTKSFENKEIAHSKLIRSKEKLLTNFPSKLKVKNVEKDIIEEISLIVINPIHHRHILMRMIIFHHYHHHHHQLVKLRHVVTSLDKIK
ncbi:hypothetical protein SNEBB_001275, partial [Seison nebaliae]